MPLLDELLVGLGFEYDPKEMKQFKDDVGKTVDIVKKLTQVATAAAAAITGVTVASTRATDEQGKLASEIGETVDNIDALQFATRIAGGSVEGMTSSLRNLSIRAAETARGVGSGVEAFGLLGISTTDVNGDLKSTSDLMLEVSQRFQGLGKAQQIELADKLGVRDSILLLQQGPDAIRELTDEARALGVTTSEDAAISEEFQDSLTGIWQITKHLARVFSRSLAPMLKKANEDWTEWWKVNKEIIELNMPKWIDNFTMAIKLLTIAVGGFIAFRLAGHLIALVALLKGVTLATLAANAAAFLLPALIAAGITAFLALAEDAKVFFEGGESFIGDMVKKFPEWKDEIVGVSAVLATVADLTERIFSGWEGIFNLFKSEGGVGDFISDLPGFLGDVTGLSTVQGGGLIPEIGQSISNAKTTAIEKMEIIVQGGADTAENIASAVLNLFQQTSEDLDTAVEQ